MSALDDGEGSVEDAQVVAWLRRFHPELLTLTERRSLLASLIWGDD